MSMEDLPGYMLDEVAKVASDIEAETDDDVQEYWESEGSQTFEELGRDLLRMYMGAKNE